MKKIKTNKLLVNVTMCYEIDATELNMYNVLTDEVKKYSDIPEDEDFSKWIIEDTEQVIRDSDDVEYKDITLEPMNENFLG